MAIKKRTAEEGRLSADPSTEKSDKPGTLRFQRKREQVIDAATCIMNKRGLDGTTLVEVAEVVGLSTSSVPYYFRTKELLAKAVFEDTLLRIEQLVDTAALAADPRSRVSAYVWLYFDLHTSIARDAARPIAILSDMRALDTSVATPLVAHYASIFRKIREFFGPAHSDLERARNTARAQVLAETIYWLPTWLFSYSYADFPRIRDRILDIFLQGLAQPGAPWEPEIITINRDDGVAKGQANFLRVATRLISELGYRGASVDKIATELNVTKGSFYYHLEAKDDLVFDCFRHSDATIAVTLSAPLNGTKWHRLTSAMATLLDIQIVREWPLLRITALQTMPEEVRREALLRSTRTSLRFAGVILDGIAEGHIRVVDPMLAAHIIMPSLNAAYELHKWADRFDDRARAVAVYASAILYGLFDDRTI